ncbi:hypothetical protein J7E73_31645 [Paenibacillus albidus]|uniref:hypothetical protein n=1 Tax=Paenibacillus albidus TaxID=2041023 RepID=UPI001BEA26AF|nr:hypothetical protein [Paenibacillus albidus]MBT2293568.1 hypothetical protein [Paenibacillus albidus]
MYSFIDVEEVDFDTVVKMLRMAYSFEAWDQMTEISDSLHKRVQSVYENTLNPLRAVPVPNLERPLVYYYGYTLLMKGLALKKLKKFSEAKDCILQYANLSWFEELDKAGEQEVKEYRFRSRAELFGIELLSGNTRVLGDYILFLQQHPQELLPGMLNILESANAHNMDIHVTLHMFLQSIWNLPPHILTQPDIIGSMYFHSFLDELLQYIMNKEEHGTAVDIILKILDVLKQVENLKVFKKTVAAFEMMREQATEAQISKFRSILISYLKEDMHSDDELVLAKTKVSSSASAC